MDVFSRPVGLGLDESVDPWGEAGKLENQLKRHKGGNGFYSLTGLPRSSSS